MGLGKTAMIILTLELIIQLAFLYEHKKFSQYHNKLRDHSLAFHNPKYNIIEMDYISTATHNKFIVKML